MNVAKTMMNAASMADVADDLTLRANGSVNVKPPTILHFIGNLGGGGAEMMMRNLVTHSASAGWRQVVVAMKAARWERELAALRECGAVVYGLEMDGLLRRATVVELIKILKDERPDVVQTWMHHADLVGGICAWWSGLRQIIWGIHCREVVTNPGDSRLRTAAFAWLLKACAQWLPARIVSCSDVALEDHVQRGYPRGKMRWIPNGIDSERFRPDPTARATQRAAWGVPSDAPLVGFIGRFHEMKQVGVFLRATERLFADLPDAHVVLCGGAEADLSPQDRAVLSRLNLGRVHFTPYQSDPEALYPALDVFSLSSRTEAFPMTLLEAMSCGVPCVTTDVGDCARIIGDTGITVPVSDDEALAAEWLKMLTESPAERKVHAEKTRARIVAEFSIERAAASYQKLYMEAMQTK